MRLLLDSHILLWWIGVAADRLSPEMRRAIDHAATVHVSAATIWELEIKRNLGKLNLGNWDWSQLDRRSVAILSIERDDAHAAGNLPLLHRDPFDRMIVAQAIRRGLTLVTIDAALAGYGAELLPA